MPHLLTESQAAAHDPLAWALANGEWIREECSDDGPHPTISRITLRRSWVPSRILASYCRNFTIC
jgi:hypothetical protein